MVYDRRSAADAWLVRQEKVEAEVLAERLRELAEEG